MRNQERIFVIGHKNPDTDSICSAIAYADIKNRTSQKVKYIPKRAGQINEETEYVLNRFGMLPPGYLSNIGTQVKDMDIRMSPDAAKSMSLKNAWEMSMDISQREKFWWELQIRKCLKPILKRMTLLLWETEKRIIFRQLPRM